MCVWKVTTLFQHQYKASLQRIKTNIPVMLNGPELTMALMNCAVSQSQNHIIRGSVKTSECVKIFINSTLVKQNMIIPDNKIVHSQRSPRELLCGNPHQKGDGGLGGGVFIKGVHALADLVLKSCLPFTSSEET